MCGLSHSPVVPPSLSACRCGTTRSISTALPAAVLQPLPCYESSPPPLPVSSPPTGLDECFFFNSLVVRLTYSLIFWQFWLVLLLKLLSLFWLCKEAQCVYLRLHFGWKMSSHSFSRVSHRAEVFNAHEVLLLSFFFHRSYFWCCFFFLSHH